MFLITTAVKEFNFALSVLKMISRPIYRVYR